MWVDLSHKQKTPLMAGHDVINLKEFK